MLKTYLLLIAATFFEVAGTHAYYWRLVFKLSFTFDFWDGPGDQASQRRQTLAIFSAFGFWLQVSFGFGSDYRAANSMCWGFFLGKVSGWLGLMGIPGAIYRTLKIIVKRVHFIFVHDTSDGDYQGLSSGRHLCMLFQSIALLGLCGRVGFWRHHFISASKL